MARDRDSRDAWQEEDEELESESKSTGLMGMIERLKNIHWVKEHPNVFKGIGVGALLLLMVLLLCRQMGWLGAAAKNPPAGAEQSAQPQPPAQQASGASKSPPSGKPKEPPKPSDQNPQHAGDKENAKPGQKPPLPDDWTKWKKDDYFRARQENHPKLAEAVVWVSERTRGSAPAAQGFTDLLKPLPPEPPPPSPKPAAPGATPPGPTPPGPTPPAPPPVPPRNPAELTKLVTTIITALGDNGSELAGKTLEQILSGTLPTDDDKAAVEAALKALAAHPNAANEALLVRAIAVPEVLRPAERQGPWPAKDLRLKALELVKPAASIELRAKLAEVMADRLGKLSPEDPVRSFLLAADLLNCGAQIVLFEKDAVAKEIKTKLEQQLADYGATALARQLKVASETPAGGGGGGSPSSSAAHQAETDLGLRLASLLWSERFGTLMNSNLRSSEGHPLDKQTDLLLLAGMLPADSTRTALAKTLRRHWNEGPKAFEAAGFPNKLVTDPGLLVVVKMFPRKESKPASRTPPPSRPGRSPPSAKATDANSAAKAAKKKEEAEQAWMALSSKLVTAWCARFKVAAEAKDKAEAEAGNVAANAGPKLPADFVLADGAKVITAYHLLWPAEAPAGLANCKPSPLEIYYVRIEETSKPKKALGYYGRQLQIKASDPRTPQPPACHWLDGLRVLLQTDHRRSVDVVLTRADNQPGDTTKDKDKDVVETDLIVEILTIEIKNPIGRE